MHVKDIHNTPPIEHKDKIGKMSFYIKGRTSNYNNRVQAATEP
jgi:hypothetical protein